MPSETAEIHIKVPAHIKAKAQALFQERGSMSKFLRRMLIFALAEAEKKDCFEKAVQQRWKEHGGS